MLKKKKPLECQVNNCRFLILPWVKSKNLASRVLGLVARKLPNDWEERYKYRPVLLETFIEKKRFKGTCYKAANWIYQGETKGRGKLGDYSKLYENVKLIMIYPLCKEFRSVLKQLPISS
ncbi:MAG: Druantia anti-phage system protein DruA [Candidatus Loosdrechtia sp.]|uniref:Druantia anti-phage system protein DruA n=1 Tax=Candidatus Loosdrechtia sp. TaxID=3101272 RepID=UPI00403A89A6